MFAVATDHELSTGAAVEVLMKGGNAVDAAIAASVALSVVDPYMSGLGGFGVAIVKRDKVYGLNFVGTAPRELRAELLTREDPWEEYRPSFDGPLSVLVPGSVAGWGELHAKFGTLDWKEVVLPAIRLARGHVVTERIWKFYEGIKGRAGQFHANYETFYKDGRFPLPGETLRQPDLASTLETLADEGWRSFYSGTLAKKTVEAVREQGGLMDDEDLRNYSPVWVDPIEVSHGNYVVYSLPQGTSGPTVLEWLNVVEELDPRGTGDRGSSPISSSKQGSWRSGTTTFGTLERTTTGCP
ncbi:hypothetical protein HS1genome_1940 [Sulfodiicoccus acidiphilus]|uniref:Gamma-glutamyltransferase n=1 Tax=Sulfodiicoccus acidiphilus TaxID=1670455 RepID=A0A348B5U9_9CREN|nr:gamma-glutamyltransferase [Sulfodiicoccus acidiphilus]BBD73551.1 hypothetical protein HS1genome_1940 [Sulfodiicoccus acidiphilus]